MDFFEAVKKRRAIRAFEKKEVEGEKLQQILETAIVAPSAGNLQAFEIFLVKDSNQKQALARAALEQEFVATAPVVLVFCANPERSAKKYGARGKELYAIQDATIAASYAQLAVAALELGSCWVGAFSPEEVLSVLGNPQGLKPIAIIPIGYPAEKPWPRPKRRLKEISHQL